jgi:transcriptional regulator GlxA family with amidase domain
MKSVNVLLYEGVDELDFAGPVAVLSSCRKLVGGRWTDRPAFQVEAIADTRATITSAHGTSILPAKALAQAYESDIVLVPGGPGAQKERFPEHVLEYLRKASYTADVVASISTGAFLVARAGLTFKQEITTHFARTADLARLYPLATVVEGRRVVVSGEDQNLMSCGGSICGIELAFALIARFEGDETAHMAARRIEWPLPVAPWADIVQQSTPQLQQRELGRL